MGPMDSTLDIIIVSYNTADVLEACLASLQRYATSSVHIFVVDNASSDHSTAMVQQCFPWVHLLANTENVGFSRANNQGAALGKGRYILYLNPDTEIRSETLTAGIHYLHDHPDVGLAGARMVNPDGSSQASISYRYPGEKFCRGDLPPLPGQIACVLGAAMFARRDVIAAVNGFDEDYFLYGEDEDLCLRIRKAGFAIGYAENSEVVHLGGQSERQTVSKEKWRKKVRAVYLFYRKHYRLDTVASIRRADRLKAWWRLITLHVMFWRVTNPDFQEKLGCYQVILEETSANHQCL